MSTETKCPTCGYPTLHLYRDTAWPDTTKAVCAECLMGYLGADWIAEQLATSRPEIVKETT